MKEVEITRCEFLLRWNEFVRLSGGVVLLSPKFEACMQGMLWKFAADANGRLSSIEILEQEPFLSVREPLGSENQLLARSFQELCRYATMNYDKVIRLESDVQKYLREVKSLERDPETLLSDRYNVAPIDVYSYTRKIRANYKKLNLTYILIYGIKNTMDEVQRGLQRFSHWLKLPDQVRRIEDVGAEAANKGIYKPAKIVYKYSKDEKVSSYEDHLDMISDDLKAEKESRFILDDLLGGVKTLVRSQTAMIPKKEGSRLPTAMTTSFIRKDTEASQTSEGQQFETPRETITETLPSKTQEYIVSDRETKPRNLITRDVDYDEERERERESRVSRVEVNGKRYDQNMAQSQIIETKPQQKVFYRSVTTVPGRFSGKESVEMRSTEKSEGRNYEYESMQREIEMLRRENQNLSRKLAQSTLLFEPLAETSKIETREEINERTPTKNNNKNSTEFQQPPRFQPKVQLAQPQYTEPEQPFQFQPKVQLAQPKIIQEDQFTQFQPKVQLAQPQYTQKEETTQFQPKVQLAQPQYTQKEETTQFQPKVQLAQPQYTQKEETTQFQPKVQLAQGDFVQQEQTTQFQPKVQLTQGDYVQQEQTTQLQSKVQPSQTQYTQEEQTTQFQPKVQMAQNQYTQYQQRLPVFVRHHIPLINWNLFLKKTVSASEHQKVKCMETAIDLESVMTGLINGKLIIWKFINFKSIFEHKIIPISESAINAMLYLNDGKTLLCGCKDGKLVKVDLNLFSSRTVCELDAPIVALANPLNGISISVASGKEICEVDIINNRVLHTTLAHDLDLTDLVYNQQKEILCSSGKDKSIKVWNANTMENLGVLQGHDDIIKSICFAYFKDNLILCSVAKDSFITFWNLSDKNLTKSLKCHSPASKVFFTWDKKTVVTVHKSGVFALWSIDKENEKDFFSNKVPYSSGIYFDDGHNIILANTEGSLEFWNAK